MSTIEKEYILPAIQIKDSLQKEETTKSYLYGGFEKNVGSFNELYTYKGLVLVAEPGNGKSRLLRELVLNAPENGYCAIFVDLKKVGGVSIESKINQYLTRGSDNPNKKEISDTAIFTPDFNLKKEDDRIIVCLDALDEVKSNQVFDCISSIKQFQSDFPNVKIVLSCRNYVFKKYEDLLVDLKLQLLEIKPFTATAISHYLQGWGFSHKEIRQVLDKFMRDYNLEVINSPRVLEIFASLKKQIGIEEVLKMSKADLLEAFIYEKLELEGKDAKKYNDLIKRVLEKLALTMEIYQSNEITKDELMTFFDDIQSNLAGNFLNVIPIEDFYERLLLVPSYDGKKIQFQNAEFQEYLAAKEITRFERSDQALFDLAMDKELHELYSSWANLIQYLVLLEPKLLPTLVTYLNRFNHSTNAKLLVRVLLSDRNLINKLSKDEILEIFRSIFKMHWDMHWYLGYDLSLKLPLYFTPEVETDLKVAIESDNETRLSNTIIMVEELITSGDLKDRDFWKNKLLSLYKTIVANSHEKVHLVRNLVSALGSFDDLKLLKENIEFKKLEREIKHELTSAAAKIDPNDKYTIDLLIESIKNDGYNIYPTKGFENIDSKDGIKYYLKKLIEDPILLSRFKHHPPDSFFLKDILDNIRKAYDEDIKNQLKTIVLSDTSNAGADPIIPDFVGILKEKTPDFALELVDYFKQSGTYPNHPYHYNQVFAILLTSEIARTFIENMLTIGQVRDRIISLFWHEIQIRKDEDSKKIFEIGREYFSAEYTMMQKQIDDYRAKYGQTNKQYETFLYKLEPEPGKYSMDVFRNYDTNKKGISHQLTPEDKEKMKNLIETVILQTDFSKVHVTYKSGQNNEYTISTIIPVFGEALAIMSDFGVKVEDHRKKIIEYLPFAFSDSRNTHIFSMLGSLTEDEMNYIYKFYETSRKDNTTEIFIHNLFDLCRNFNLVSLVPKLKEVILDTKVEDYRRKEALDIINLILPDLGFNKTVFDVYSNSIAEGDKYILSAANEFLVVNKGPHQREAIKWRMELIVNEYSVLNPKPTRFSDSLNSSLVKVIEIDYKDLFVDFYTEGIKIHQKGSEYNNKAYYLWATVGKYLENLKVYRNYSPLRFFEEATVSALKKFDYTLKIDAEIYLFRLIGNLKIIYADLIGKPLSYLESIRKYNAIRNTDYSKVNTPEDFHIMLEEILNRDIKNWVENEGAYDFFPKANEDLIQKTLKTQLWNALLKRGIRDCDIRREEQTLDNLRTDFVINYGFIGQILIEIKLCDNPEVTDPSYKAKLMQYINGTNSHYGVFLIFQTTDKNHWKDQEPTVRAIYQDHLESKRLLIFGMKCIKDSVAIPKKGAVKKPMKKIAKKPIKKSAKKKKR